MKKMLVNGVLYQYRGLEVRYIDNKPGGQALVLFNGVKMIVDRHEILTIKLKEIA